MPDLFDLRGKRVWVAGDGGMLGSAIVRQLQREACVLLRAPRAAVDLRRQDQTERWVSEARPDVVFVAAAKVGGILANATQPADFLYDNLMIETNIIEAARKSGVAKLVFMGSSCIYPKLATQPIEEDSLLTGPLEPTNEWYAIAKIAGVKLCQAYRAQYGVDYISAMPTNLYGPGDNFDLTSSHVLPALIRKAHDAKTGGARHLTVWGTGTPRREFMHVDDCANAIVHLAKHYSGREPVNVGSGQDIAISALAELVAHVVGFEGEITYDISKPDGTPRKLMSSRRLQAMGWAPVVSLPEGIASVYQWFLQNER